MSLPSNTRNEMIAASMPILLNAITSGFSKELKELHTLNPNLKRLFILNSWSGWCDGNQEHPVFSGPLGEYVFEMLGEHKTFRGLRTLEEFAAHEKKKGTKFLLQNLKNLPIGGSGYGGYPVAYSDDELKEVHRFLLDDYKAFEKYMNIGQKIAQEALQPVTDLVELGKWIEIPING